jgi:hypothetical protein
MRKRAATIDPDEVLVNSESHWAGAPSGENVFYPEGQRLRRGKIAAFSSAFWLPDGSDAADLQQAREHLHAEPSAEPSAPEKPKKRVRAVKAFSVTVPVPIAGTNLTTGDRALRIVSVGDEFDADDAIVLAHQDAFDEDGA